MQIEVESVDLMRLFTEGFFPSPFTDEGKVMLKEFLYGPEQLLIRQRETRNQVQVDVFLWNQSVLIRKSEQELWDLYQKVKSTH